MSTVQYPDETARMSRLIWIYTVCKPYPLQRSLGLKGLRSRVRARPSPRAFFSFLLIFLVINNCAMYLKCQFWSKSAIKYFDTFLRSNVRPVVFLWICLFKNTCMLRRFYYADKTCYTVDIWKKTMPKTYSFFLRYKDKHKYCTYHFWFLKSVIIRSNRLGINTADQPFCCHVNAVCQWKPSLQTTEISFTMPSDHKKTIIFNMLFIILTW